MALGDFDGDQVNDISVGSPNEGSGQGGVVNLFLHHNGTVKSTVKIGDNQGGFTGTFNGLMYYVGGDSFIGDNDIDGDGVTDIIIRHSRPPVPQPLHIPLLFETHILFPCVAYIFIVR